MTYDKKENVRDTASHKDKNIPSDFYLPGYAFISLIHKQTVLKLFLFIQTFYNYI